MSPDPISETADTDTETPGADVIQRVASALEATESGEPAPKIVRAEGGAAPLPPRRSG